MKGNKNKVILEFIDFSFFYNKQKREKPTLNKISFKIYLNSITAIIGPSGCGKSTLLATINRLHEINYFSTDVLGEVKFHDQSIYGSKTNVVKLRKKIGLVFQKPAPFPMSIYENIAFAPKIHGEHNGKKLQKIVETSLKQVNL